MDGQTFPQEKSAFRSFIPWHLRLAEGRRATRLNFKRFLGKNTTYDNTIANMQTLKLHRARVIRASLPREAQRQGDNLRQWEGETNSWSR